MLTQSEINAIKKYVEAKCKNMIVENDFLFGNDELRIKLSEAEQALDKLAQ